METSENDEQPEKKARPKRRIKSSILVAATLAVGVTLWILSGNLPPELAASLQSPGETAESAETVADAEAPTEVQRKIPSVRIYESSARTRQAMIRIAGLTEASRSGRIMAETVGAIRVIDIEEGDIVSKGDALGRIEIDERTAIVREAEALVAQRVIEYDAAAKLASKGFQSEIRRAQAHAELEAAKASLDRAKLDLSKTRVAAPFDGVVATKDAEVGDLVQVGDLIATVVDLDPLLIVAKVSEREVGLLTQGGLAEARLITGETVQGIVSYIAPRADENTRTFRVEVEISDTGNRLKAGVTAELQLPAKQSEAHLISPALLTLNDVGDVGVKTVDDQKKVRFFPIRVIEDTPEGLWVLGLPETTTLISVGQEFVSDGEEVDPVPATVFAPDQSKS